MTPDQGKQLANFMSITIEEDGVDINGEPWYWSPELDKHWNPEFDWRDFGPLWVLLWRWLSRNDASGHGAISEAFARWHTALRLGTDRDIMQAGCLLGAAIGSTMTAAPTAQEPK